MNDIQIYVNKFKAFSQNAKMWAKQNRIAFIAAVSGVCVVLLLLLVAASSSGGPEKVALTYLKCATRLDLKGVEKVVARDVGFNAKRLEAEMEREFKHMGLSLKQMKKVKVNVKDTVDDVEIDGREATVWVTRRAGKMKDSGRVELRKERGKWRVSDVDPRLDGGMLRDACYRRY